MDGQKHRRVRPCSYFFVRLCWLVTKKKKKKEKGIRARAERTTRTNTMHVYIYVYIHTYTHVYWIRICVRAPRREGVFFFVLPSAPHASRSSAISADRVARVLFNTHAAHMLVPSSPRPDDTIVAPGPVHRPPTSFSKGFFLPRSLSLSFSLTLSLSPRL